MKDSKFNKKGKDFYLSLEKYMQKLAHLARAVALNTALISMPLPTKTKRKLIRDIKKELKKLEESK